MPPTTGLLSHAIQNLQVLIPSLTVSSFFLPAEAQAKEVLIVKLLQAEIKKITDIQPVVKQFVAYALPLLQQAKTDLDAGTNLDHVVSIITRTSASAIGLKQNVDALSADITTTKDQIINFSTSLAPLQTQLNAEKITLNTQLESLRRDIREGREGGVAGLVKLMEQCNSIQDRINTLNVYKQSIDLMTTYCLSIITKLSNVGNAVNFLASDDSEVINDLRNTQGDQLKAKLYLTTAISQVQTLATDAA